MSNSLRRSSVSSGSSQGQPGRNGSVSGSYSQLNSSLHARVKAFQEQRQLKRSGSIHSNQSQNSVQIEQIVNKPLPPLPPKTMVEEAKNSLEGDLQKEQKPEPHSQHSQHTSLLSPASTENGQQQAGLLSPDAELLDAQQKSGQTGFEKDTQDALASLSIHSEGSSPLSSGGTANATLDNVDVNATANANATATANANANTTTTTQQDHELNPIRKAPRPPQGGLGGVSMAGMGAPTGAGAIPSSQPRLSQGQPHLQKAKQSLSARRGLKLPPAGMSLKMKPTVQQQPVAAQHTHQEFAGAPSNSAIPVQGRRSNPGSLINGVQSTSTSLSSLSHETADTDPRSNPTSNSNSGIGGLFANFSKYVNIKSGSLNFAGKLSLSSKGVDFSNGSSFRITLDELEFLEELGHGNYGNVSKVLHKPTHITMAMKEVRLELDESKFRQILMELEVLHNCQSPYIVDFYGAFFIEGAVYMCMEYMDGGSLDKTYDDEQIGGIDEPQLARITSSVIQGLKELKDVHNIIHRDVKPTNILCSASQGTIKLCDFGVSGNLVASLAKTNIGCQSYMAPERIKSLNPDKSTYSVQSDIWSLGLSILEMALGAYPYPPETFDNIFSQLSAIVDGPPPKLPEKKFSADAQNFVSMCLQKIPERRPTYAALLEHPWLKKYENVDVGMSDYITTRLNKKREWLEQKGDGVHKHVPALHMGGL
ncbi:unnamed protein product [Kluyveromyces dobzhanskii CBS 2104]|uniref:mitogen-activated protein kinase kinase n=1 Tax=Kluyveromyces dobzhanskii CBS 2104 TaxID=1427455 RepID=A0A0A8L7D8_9SACH|nr:unnamed protein product [Kluyveromyces dobzhanskii CBS 2104]